MNLTGFNLGLQSAKTISQIFKYKPEIRELIIPKNLLGDAGAKALSHAVGNAPELISLNLSNNRIVVHLQIQHVMLNRDHLK